MNPRSLALLAALAAVTAPGSASALGAQTPVPVAADTLPLTLDAALRRAVGESEEVRLARAQVELADAQVTTARAAALPQLNANINYTRTFASPFSAAAPSIPDSLLFDPDPTLPLAERVAYLEDRVPTAAVGGLGSLFGNLPFGRENAYTATLSGSQLLYSGGRVGAALNIARDFEEVARLGLREETAEVVLQVRSAYYRAALAEELERIAAEALAQAERFLADVRLRLQAGTASELDALRAEVAMENLRPQLVEARNAAQLARLDLKRLVNVPLSQPVRLATPLTVPDVAALAAAPPVDPGLSIAQRAAVEAAERQVSIGEEQVRIARGAFLPQVSLSMNYGGQLYPSTMTNLSGDWRRDWTATVGVQIPIFSGLQRQGELAQARVNLEQRRLQLAQLREGVQLSYEQAASEREQARAAIAARQRTVEQAQRVHDLTVLRYEQGLATQLEVSDARLALLQARTNVAQALADYYVADAGVTRALGLADPITTLPDTSR